jgi:hypothetical protein
MSRQKSCFRYLLGIKYSENSGDPKSGVSLIGAALLSEVLSFKRYAQPGQPTDTLYSNRFENQKVHTRVLSLLLGKVKGNRLNTPFKSAPIKRRNPCG